MAAANALNNLARAAVGIGAGVSLLQSSMYNVDGGFRAVMFDRYRGVQAALHSLMCSLVLLSTASASQGAATPRLPLAPHTPLPAPTSPCGVIMTSP